MSRRLPRPRAVLFDWDNTLVDSWGCIMHATNVTMRRMGRPEWTLAETRRRVALSLRDSFPKMFGDRWTEARDIFYREYEAIHLDRLTPLPGAAAMLAELAGQGMWLGVVSNKNGGFLRGEAERLGWTGYFQRLVGATDAAEDKPAIAPIRLALSGSGIEPGDAVWFVGDAPVDTQCAANAGCVPVLLRLEKPADGEFLHPPLHHLPGCAEFAALVRQLAVPICRN